MRTRDIRTSQEVTVCDVCGRTLLRGERADIYLNGGARRSVCELCKSRALHEGWVREGTVAAYERAGGGSERRRSLLSRLRGRPRPVTAEPPDEKPLGPMRPQPGITLSPPSAAGNGRRPRPVADPAAGRRRGLAGGEPIAREHRHVRAVPTSAEQLASAAVELFNLSEHRRTVAGVARSLGRAAVHVAPSLEPPGLVAIVVSWELCWYRYEVDLSAEHPAVRLAGQGYELEELSTAERTPNAQADEDGMLSAPRLQ